MGEPLEQYGRLVRLRVARNRMQRNATDSAEWEPSPAQTKAVAALLSGTTFTEAAKQVGVDRSTIHRWKKDPNFAAHYNRERVDYLSAYQEKLRSLVPEAIDVLHKFLKDEDLPPSTRLRAVQTILQSAELDHPAPIGPTDPAQLRISQLVGMECL